MMIFYQPIELQLLALTTLGLVFDADTSSTFTSVVFLLAAGFSSAFYFGFFPRCTVFFFDGMHLFAPLLQMVIFNF